MNQQEAFTKLKLTVAKMGKEVMQLEEEEFGFLPLGFCVSNYF